MSGLIGALYQNQQFQQGATVDALAKIAAMQEKNRADELTRKFLSMGDYSPANIQKFAQETGATQDDIGKLMGIAKDALQYKESYDPLVTVNEVDEMGRQTSKMVPRSQVAGKEITTGLAPQETVVDSGTGLPVKKNERAAYAPGQTLSALYANDQQMKYNMGRDKVEDQQFNTQQSNAMGMFNTREANEEARSKREYDYREKTAEQMAIEKSVKEKEKQVIGQYNFLVKNILPEEKTMLFDSAEDLDSMGAQSIVEKLNKKVADPDPTISARARKALALFESIAQVSGSFTNSDDWEEVTDPNILNQIKFR